MKLSEYERDLAEIISAMDHDDYSEEEIAEAVDAWLGGAEGLGEKLDAYAAVIAERERYAETRKAEADRLLKLVKSDTSLAEWLRARLLSFLQITGRDRVETELHKFRVQANGGVRRVLVPDVDELPPEYRTERVTIMPNAARIREAIECGEDVPGATLAERGYSVRIQ